MNSVFLNINKINIEHDEPRKLDFSLICYDGTNVILTEIHGTEVISTCVMLM